MNTHPTDVLTPLAACALFGRSGEAVRRAAREGHVRTQLSIMFTAKQVRLIDLRSALAYWGKPRYAGQLPLEDQLSEMRRFGFILRCPDTDEEFSVLHPYPSLVRHDFDITEDVPLID